MNNFISEEIFPILDLAAEAGAALRGETDEEIPGVVEEIKEGPHCRLSKIIIENEEGSALMKRPQGTYITVETRGDLHEENCQQAIIRELSTALISMLPQNKEAPVLLCGIGNPDIASDALGEETVSRITPTRHLTNLPLPDAQTKELRPVALFAPNVLGNTGMEASEQVQAVIKQIQPCAAVVIDALATASWERLGTSFQLTDTGISPGGGIGNRRPAITEETCGIPVIAIGVPTVIYPHAIVNEVLIKMKEQDPSLITAIKNSGILKEILSEQLSSSAVTPKDIDTSVKLLGYILAESIENALHNGTIQNLYR